MKGNWKELNKEKRLFKTVYCLGCKQRKVCGKLDYEHCCPCYYEIEQERTKEYSSYDKVFASKQQEQKEKFLQLQLLKSYQGCKQCGSLATDAYSLYENNQLVCQPCLIRKEGSSSSPISFLEQEKWYKRCWGINLTEWLEREGVYSEPSQNFFQLPINKKCANKWRENQEHLKNCACLEQESQETYLLFANSSREKQEKLKECRCETSEKVRVDYLDSAGSGWTYCEKCETRIGSAGHHGVIKNRNDPKFWGLEVKEKILCGDCLEGKKEGMPSLRRAEFNRYRKVGRL